MQINNNSSSSRLTFALLKDSGWYEPNFDLAQELSWGRGLGCDFALKSCKELLSLKEAKPDTHGKIPYCNRLMQVTLKKIFIAEGDVQSLHSGGTVVVPGQYAWRQA